jgi:hypothetical protein
LRRAGEIEYNGSPLEDVAPATGGGFLQWEVRNAVVDFPDGFTITLYFHEPPYNVSAITGILHSPGLRPERFVIDGIGAGPVDDERWQSYEHIRIPAADLEPLSEREEPAADTARRFKLPWHTILLAILSICLWIYRIAKKKINRV